MFNRIQIRLISLVCIQIDIFFIKSITNMLQEDKQKISPQRIQNQMRQMANIVNKMSPEIRLLALGRLQEYAEIAGEGEIDIKSLLMNYMYIMHTESNIMQINTSDSGKSSSKSFQLRQTIINHNQSEASQSQFAATTSQAIGAKIMSLMKNLSDDTRAMTIIHIADAYPDALQSILINPYEDEDKINKKIKIYRSAGTNKSNSQFIMMKESQFYELAKRRDVSWYVGKCEKDFNVERQHYNMTIKDLKGSLIKSEIEIQALQKDILQLKSTIRSQQQIIQQLIGR